MPKPFKFLIILFGGILLFPLFNNKASVVAGPLVITLNPIADTAVRQRNPSTNYGSDSSMLLGSELYYTGQGYVDNRILMRFSLSNLPQNAVIEKATLRLKFASNPLAGVNYYVKNLAANWYENTVTWTIKPGTSASPPASLAQRLSLGSVADYKEIPVTEIVKGWVSRQYVNYGFEISTPLVNSSNSAYVYSRDSQGAKPQLVVEYTLPDIIPPTITNVQAFDITKNSAKIGWSTNEYSDSYVSYWKTGQQLIPAPVGYHDHTLTHTYSLSGLSPNTLYSYKVISNDSSANKGESATFTFKTLNSIIILDLPTLTPTPTATPTLVPGEPTFTPAPTSTPEPPTGSEGGNGTGTITPGEDWPTGNPSPFPTGEINLTATPGSLGGTATQPGTPKSPFGSLFGAFTGKNLLLPLLIIVFLGFFFIVGLIIIIIIATSNKKKTNPPSPVVNLESEKASTPTIDAGAPVIPTVKTNTEQPLPSGNIPSAKPAPETSIVTPNPDK